MIKKLILIFVLTLILGVPAMAQVDSSKVFVYGSGFIALPTDDGAGTYDPYFGFQFEGHYKLGERYSVGGTYKEWKLRGEGSRQDMSMEYKAVVGTYWVHPYGSHFNLGVMAQVGQSKVVTEEGTNKNMAEVFGMVLKKHIYQKVYAVGTLKIGQFGELDENCLMISLGIGAPL